MRFVTFEVETSVGPVERIGVLEEQQIIDLHGSYAAYLKEVRRVWRWQELASSILPPNMLRFIEGGAVSMEALRHALEYAEKHGDEAEGRGVERLRYRLSEVRLLAPVPRPVSIRDCSSFLQHHRNMAQGRELPPDIYELPLHYRSSSTDVVGQDAPIIWPGYTERLDYELEFAICIGKYGVDIPVENAGEYIFGYTAYNDISARDIQVREMRLGFGPAKGKSFRNSNIMGPCLVTPDEIDPTNLRMTVRVNGEPWSEGTSKGMLFSFPELISYLSKGDPLYPGEFIASGTVGFGSGVELGRWIKPGDMIELEVEGIGVLRNRVERRTGEKR
jgi:2-keto-4-pentenoate hydratase/2-oxohepta-3-ene-1,7-dioic acid hydratase in catechol pathway